MAEWAHSNNWGRGHPKDFEFYSRISFIYSALLFSKFPGAILHFSYSKVKRSNLTGIRVPYMCKACTCECDDAGSADKHKTTSLK